MMMMMTNLLTKYFKTMTTNIKVKCVSKKESANTYLGDVKAHPKNFAIELGVDYDPNSVYYQMSGGTNIILNTVNEVAADGFIIGKDYMITIAEAE